VPRIKVHLSRRPRLGAAHYPSASGHERWIVRLLFLRLIVITQ
jgi:hypothetical protein